MNRGDYRGQGRGGRAEGGEGRGRGRGGGGGRGGGRGKMRGRGRGRTASQETSSSSTDQSMLTEYADSSYSSERSTEPDLSLEEDLSLISLQLNNNNNTRLQPPQQRLKKLFPGLANTGRPCRVQTNHFSLNVKLPQGVVHMYEVTILPPWTRKYRKSDKVLYHRAISAWKERCRAVSGEKYCWVFDGYKQLYSTRRHHNQEFSRAKVTVWSEEEEKEVELTVQDVTYVMPIRINQEILEWACKGRSGDIPQDSLEALNVVLKQGPVSQLGWTSIGRCFFPPDGTTIDLGFGKEAWTGVFSTIRPHGWKDDKHNILLTLNVDTFNKPAVKPMHLIKDGYILEVLTSRKFGKVNLKEGLTSHQVSALGKDLKDLKVRYEVPDKNGVRKRNYRVNDVRKLEAYKEKINVDGQLLSIVDYFKKQYNLVLKYPKLPCLHVGARDKTTYIPMEFCSLLSQPMPRKKKLPDEAVANMIRHTAIKPLDRQRRIMEELKKNNAMYRNDRYAREFGISLAGEMTSLTGRILAPPSIEYRNHSVAAIKEDNPGKWFMSHNHHYVDGRTVRHWALFDLASLGKQHQETVKTQFCKVGKSNGLQFDPNPFIVQVNISMDDAHARMEEFLKRLKAQFKGELELILIVLPFKVGFLYDKIKRLGDLELNLVTQCCLSTNLFRKGEINTQVISNLCLKINSKLGGKNHVISQKRRSAILDRPVMIMGADVSHPAPDARGVKPSIAAIVASMEPKAVTYEVAVRVQDMGLESNEEVISDMKDVTKKLLMKFYKANNGRKPEKIVMFRDGVSEGQFLTVLSSELAAIREACTELETEYKPPITFIVVQKRHHTRFFPSDQNQYRNGNVLAGTVIDQGINHPTEGDFYLVSHEGIQGTSKPCHYQVLWDDSDHHADELETLAYYLCHLYSRCTRSVSYPAPTYYAHLVADRARKHHNDLAGAGDWGGSSSGSAGSLKISEADRRKIQETLEAGVSQNMYFV